MSQQIRTTVRRLAQRRDAAAARSRSVRAQQMVRGWLRGWGQQGVLAFGVLILCPAFYLSAIVPAQEQLEATRRKAAALRQPPGMPGGAVRRTADTPADQLVTFYKQLPAERALPDALEKLVVVAEKHGIGLNEGDYKLTRENAGKLVRFQMTLPLKGTYPQIRQFLAALPEEMPALALENIQFDRQKVADPIVEVKVRFVLFLEKT